VAALFLSGCQESLCGLAEVFSGGQAGCAAPAISLGWSVPSERLWNTPQTGVLPSTGNPQLLIPPQ